MYEENDTRTHDRRCKTKIEKFKNIDDKHSKWRRIGKIKID